MLLKCLICVPIRCIRMEILSKWEFDRAESNGEEDPRITLLYEETDYEEVTNTKSFDFASLVSGVGGFIGIFLGYSILQIPDVLELLPATLSNLRRNIKKVSLVVSKSSYENTKI